MAHPFVVIGSPGVFMFEEANSGGTLSTPLIRSFRSVMSGVIVGLILYLRSSLFSTVEFSYIVGIV